MARISRLLAVPAAVVVLVAALTLPSRADVFAESFWDLLPNDPYVEAIDQLRRMGVLSGYPDGSFRGSETVTRRELALVVSRMIGYFERALPPSVQARQLSPADISEIRSIGYDEAVRMLRDRYVAPDAYYYVAPAAAATLDDVAVLVEGAIAYLTERVLGEDKLTGDPEPAHSH